MSEWTVAPEPAGSADARALWREYYTEVSDRWYLLHENRRTLPEELEREVVKETGAELAPPTGLFLLARYEGRPVGSAGIRLTADGPAELKRVYLRAEARGKGGADVLLDAAEAAAFGLGARALILDTRKDLVEAVGLYTRRGFRRTSPPPGPTRPYAEVWFRKELKGPGAGG